MKKTINCIALSVLWLFVFQSVLTGQQRAYSAPKFAEEWDRPGAHPDHIVLNFSGDPATSISVTWRTDTTVAEAYAEIAPATAAPKFWRNAVTTRALTERMDARSIRRAEVVSHYHSVTFEELEPDSLYAYRVGDGEIWSEWVQFRTAAREAQPFSFLYVGDAQNFILELWARLIREGYRKAPDARFIIHAGDLVNSAHSERQWHEWFVAGGWIHRMLPSLPIVGNHEYDPYQPTIGNGPDQPEPLSVQWRPQFTLPTNGPEGLEETVYYVDYQDVRIIGLNTMEQIETQTQWLEQVLADNPNTWTVATFHHPVFSASADRDNQTIRELWKPLFDQYGVDIALQGHDHSYARGTAGRAGENVVGGFNTRDSTGTVYVVSVSGGKMYDLKPNGWEDYQAERERAAENTQLFQVIRVDGNRLSYEAYTATGALYDAFDLVKEEGSNRLVERKQEAIPARRFDNTIPYDDELPEDIEADLLRRYPGYDVSSVRYMRNVVFRGYIVELKKEDQTIGLWVGEDGKIMEEQKDRN